MVLVQCSCGSRSGVGDRDIERFYGSHIAAGHTVKTLCYECEHIVRKYGDNPVEGCLNCEDYTEAIA